MCGSLSHAATAVPTGGKISARLGVIKQNVFSLHVSVHDSLREEGVDQLLVRSASEVAQSRRGCALMAAPLSDRS